MEEIQPLTRDESRIVLESTRDRLPEFYPLLLTALRTGLRQGELLGLQWPDIDFDGKFIAIRRALVKGQLTTPKNHQLRRVDMSEQLAKELRDHRARLHAHWWKKGKPAPI
jgi:integrase